MHTLYHIGSFPGGPKASHLLRRRNYFPGPTGVFPPPKPGPTGVLPNPSRPGPTGVFPLPSAAGPVAPTSQVQSAIGSGIWVPAFSWSNPFSPCTGHLCVLLIASPPLKKFIKKAACLAASYRDLRLLRITRRSFGRCGITSFPAALLPG